MDNRKLGLILIITCIVLGFIVFTFNQALDEHQDSSCECEDMAEGGICPMEPQPIRWQTYAGIILIAAITALGIYLIFFEKSQKEIISTLEKQKQIQSNEEKFNILLKGLNTEEQKVIKAVRKQDGITQQTLRLRTDLHKSKLSIVLDGLDKKGLIKKVKKGKTNQIFIKIDF